MNSVSSNIENGPANGKPAQAPAASNLVAWTTWLRSIDRDGVTGWRWRQRGLIAVINIYGKLYVSRDEIARFEARAVSGEFARVRTLPFGKVGAA